MKLSTHASKINCLSSNRRYLQNDPLERFEIFNLNALDPTDYITFTFYTLYRILYYNSIYPQVKIAHEE